MTEPTQTEGQANGTSIEATTEAPGGENGQSVASNQTTNDGLGSADTFYNPNDLPPEMQQIYKSMQSAFTKKTQEISKSREKIAAYDRFATNPMGTLQQLAQQYGYQLVHGSPQNPGQTATKEPQTWDDVMNMAEQTVRPKIMKELEPILNEVKTLKKQTIQQQLSSIDPNWIAYEDEMMQNLNEHPTLVKNPELLYRMSVPAEVLEAQAIKKAKAKMQETVNGGQLSGGSRTNQKPSTNKPAGNFDEAVKIAKAQLEAEGIRP